MNANSVIQDTNEWIFSKLHYQQTAYNLYYFKDPAFFIFQLTHEDHPFNSTLLQYLSANQQ